MVRDEYRIRRDERQSWLDALNRRHDRLADLRLATIGLGVVVACSPETVTLRFESGVVRVNSPFDRLTRL